MDADQYQRDALRTENTPDFVRLGKGPDHDTMVARLIHATLGMASEVGELADALKKHQIDTSASLDQQRRMLDAAEAAKGDIAAGDRIGADVSMNTEDNQTALEIAEMKVGSAEQIAEDKNQSAEYIAEQQPPPAAGGSSEGS